ncbi:MAG TPA: exosortase-associated EpsI family protein [Verrucomicrobiae bacterium]|nr:exosortase-associated EpsI family protein [Verrucomicrobiae bacterium]
MKSQRILVFIIALVLIAGGGGALNWLKKNQKLGTPGIKATPIPGDIRMNFDLPARVLDYTSERLPQDKTVLDMLPKDTSYAQRRYTETNGFWVNGNIILMGMDRTSIHKPEFCLPGQGWHIDQKATVDVPIEGRDSYQLRVAKWTITNFVQDNDGRKQEVRGLYVFWFVTKNEETTSHWQRIWWLTRDLLTTGILQRWAYVSYFTICLPGQEDATFDRMKKLIAASVPEFQLPPEAK